MRWHSVAPVNVVNTPNVKIVSPVPLPVTGNVTVNTAADPAHQAVQQDIQINIGASEVGVAEITVPTGKILVLETGRLLKQYCR